MPKKRKFILPTPAEDAAINAGIAADPDTYELSDAEFAQLRRMPDRPKAAVTKERITIRLSHAINAQSMGSDSHGTRLSAKISRMVRN